MQQKSARLGEMLLQTGLIDQFQLDSALSYHRNMGGRIGSALVKLGYVSLETVQKFVARQTKCPVVDLAELTFSPSLLNMIPAAKLYKCKAFPVELRKDGKGRSLIVAMADPDNLFLVDDLQFMAGCRVIPASAPEEDILAALKRYFPRKKSETVYALPDAGDPTMRSLRAREERLDRLIDLLKARGILTQSEVDQLK